MTTKIPAAIKTPPRKSGARAAGIDPRKGEDLCALDTKPIRVIPTA